jgi:outer membrane immunogenic protein
MKKLLIAGAILASFAATQSASAADMALKAPPPPVIYDWTGFYLGINGGYSWGRSATDFTGPGLVPFSTSQKMNGWLGGGQAGYNWQFNKSWVLGLEADIQGTGQRGTDALPTSPPCPLVVVAVVPCTTTTGTFQQKLEWFGTVRARLGVEPSDHWLLYVTGGLAYGDIKTIATASAVTTAGAGGPVTGTATATASNSTIKAGWTIGGGAEWVLSGPWTAKLEYLYMDYGHVSTSLALVGFYPLLNTNSHVTDNVVRAGINYRVPR